MVGEGSTSVNTPVARPTLPFNIRMEVSLQQLLTLFHHHSCGKGWLETGKRFLLFCPSDLTRWNVWAIHIMFPAEMFRMHTCPAEMFRVHRIGPAGIFGQCIFAQLKCSECILHIMSSWNVQLHICPAEILGCMWSAKILNKQGWKAEAYLKSNGIL